MKRLVDNKEGISLILQLIAAIIIPILLVRITGSLNKRNRIEEQTFEHKKAIFEKFLDLLLDSMAIDWIKKKITEDKRKESMVDFKKKLILYASEKTLQTFNNWVLSNNKEDTKGTNSEEGKKGKKKKIRIRMGKRRNPKPLRSVDRFLYYLRRDLGLEDKKYKLLRKRRFQRIQVFISDRVK